MRKLMFVALLAGGCTGASSTGIEEVSCPTGSTLTYESFGQAFLEAHCLECHETKESPRLTSAALVRANGDDILHEAVYTTAMPEDEDLSIEEREMLGEWIACGAP